MEYIKKELKKILSLGCILFGIGLSINLGYGFILLGTLLLFDHMWSYGRFDFFDFLGHETFGLAFLIIGFCLIQSWIGIIFVIIGYLIGCRFKWTQSINPFSYAIKKIRGLLLI